MKKNLKVLLAASCLLAMFASCSKSTKASQKKTSFAGNTYREEEKGGEVLSFVDSKYCFRGLECNYYDYNEDSNVLTLTATEKLGSTKTTYTYDSANKTFIASNGAILPFKETMSDKDIKEAKELIKLFTE
ncbi:hypothetical protein [Treponema sp.]|uniref:hypothetical protein n=1 Tax=Treponema sp. TaxID=166 RepID=UPI0025DF930B|nr:hypothetical protein [Treponema sp.]MCR5217511.1 hypothetical protein [Treponema sp.]